MHMKRILWIVLVILTAGIGKLQAQTASFNFSLTSHPVGGGWVNIYGNPAAAVCSGTSSGITVSSDSTSNWAPFSNGFCASDGGGASGGTFFPSGVMLNHWFQYSSFYAQYNSLVPQLLISGLNQDSVYTIKMTGSFVPIGSFELNPIRYTVTGTIIYGYVDINGDNNTSDGAVFHNVAPDANGKVKVYVNTFGTSNTASISGIQIISGHTSAPTPVVALVRPTNNNIIPEDGNVSISATASESGGTIQKVEFYADTTKIGEDSTAPYSMVWTGPDPGNYQIKARAIDGFGNTSTATANITVQSLNYFWSTTGNIATGGDTSFVGTVDTNRLAFRTNNIERMSILGDGTVGIGTKNTYGYKLAVNGNAIFTKVRIKTAGTWPDYVFKKGYVLPNLNQLEEYISLHRHLPGITPEGEISRDGFDISEQQTALLKKVEELTLYLIDENKQLKAQNKENVEQNKQITEQNARLEQQQREIDELRRLIKKK